MLKNLDKAPTHTPGLDDILQGGLPRGRTTVINGGPGSGKTLLALEFLYRGALAGEAGIFLGFEEPLERLRQNAASLGWDIPARTIVGSLSDEDKVLAALGLAKEGGRP